MVATVNSFTFYNKFKQQLGLGAINLSAATTFYAQLLSSASNVADATLSTLASVTGTCTGSGYKGTKALTNVVWTAASAADAGTYRWDFDAIVFTASTGPISNVKYCQIYQSLGAGTGLPVGYWQLVTAETEVTENNTVTITPNTYCFSMSG